MRGALTRLGLRIWARLWWWSNLGIGVKMTIIVIVGTFALVGLFLYLATAALNDNIERSLQERVALASSTARHVDYVLGEMASRLGQAAREEAIANSEERAEALQAAYEHLGFFGQQLYYTDREGAILAAYPASWSDVSFTNHPALESILKNRTLAVASDAKRLTVAAVPVFDASSQWAGVLILRIDLSSNWRVFIDPKGFADTGYMDLVDNQGRILESTRAERVGQLVDHNAVLARQIQIQQPLVSRCHSCHDESGSTQRQAEVLAMAPLTQAPWGITVRQDEAQILAAAHGLQWRILSVGALALAGALFLVYLTTHSVISPVQMLTAATQRIAAGDLDTPIGEYGRDEVGVLARSFDTMRARLFQSMTEIQKWNRELDARVQERTAALQAAQQEEQQARDHLQAIIDSLSDDLLVLDREYHVIRMNATAQRKYGSRSLTEGAQCYQLSHGGIPCQTLDCECPVPSVLETTRPFRVTHMHPNGASPRYIEVTASPLVDAQGHVSGVVEVQRDVTDERNLEETILQRNRELSAVNAIARVMGQSTRLDECLQLALNEVRRITRMDMGAIFLLEGEGNSLVLRVCYGLVKEVAEATGRFALSDAACGGVLEIGEPVIVQNPSRVSRLAQLASCDTLSSLIHVPLSSKGAALGTLCLGTYEPRSFADEEISLLSAIGSQIAVAVENARLYEELSHKEQLRRELLRRLISAQEDERKRIARELHDETSQTLTALLYAIDAAGETRDQSKLPAYLSKMRHLTGSAIDGVHKLIFDLRPTMLDQLGLIAALRWYAESRLEEAGARVEVTETGKVQRLPSALETALFRTVQEAISNIARHAGARHVAIHFDFQADRAEIRVEDDGIGFDPRQVSASADPRCGLGLVSMEERMNAVGGEFFLTSVPGEGTTITLRAALAGGTHGSDSDLGGG